MVSATGAVFGKDAAGNMGYLDGMTSEAVDKGGNANIAAAAARHLPKACYAPGEVLRALRHTRRPPTLNPRPPPQAMRAQPVSGMICV